MVNRVRLFTPLELATAAGLLVMPAKEPGVVRRDDPILWVGPGASDDLIATTACRCHLHHRGIHSEARVRALVINEGYDYVRPAGVVGSGAALTKRRVRI
jgi:hypothetical protein